MATCELFYDFSSPFAYLAATQIERVCRGHELVWRPFLLGGLFKAIGTPIVPLATFPRNKQLLALKDQYRWAEHWGVRFEFPSRFPQNTVTALRVALQAGEKIGPLSLALFEAIWVHDENLEDPETIARVVREQGLDADALLAGAREQAVKDRLRASTEEAAARGVVGAPTCIVGDLVFWGQDRLHFVEKALAGWKPGRELDADRMLGRVPPIDQL